MSSDTNIIDYTNEWDSGKKHKHVPCCTCQSCRDEEIDRLTVELKTKDEKIKRLYKLLADYGWMGENVEEAGL